MGSETTTTVEQEATSRSGINLDPMGALERLGGNISQEQLQSISDLVSRGPGTSDVEAAVSSGRSFAELLESAAASGGLPSEQDVTQSQGFIDAVFAPQEVAMEQSFERQREQQARQAARLGRSVNDPVLANMLARSQTEQGAMLEAQRGAALAQQSQATLQNRLGLAGQAAQARAGLASQALANRQLLLGLGNTIQQQGRQFRLQTGTRFGEQSSFNQQTVKEDPGFFDIAGGILGGAASIGGAVTGVGALAGGIGSAVDTVGGWFGGGGGSVPGAGGPGSQGWTANAQTMYDSLNPTYSSPPNPMRPPAPNQQQGQRLNQGQGGGIGMLPRAF